MLGSSAKSLEKPLGKRLPSEAAHLPPCEIHLSAIDLSCRGDGDRPFSSPSIQRKQDENHNKKKDEAPWRDSGVAMLVDEYKL